MSMPSGRLLNVVFLFVVTTAIACSPEDTPQPDAHLPSSTQSADSMSHEPPDAKPAENRSIQDAESGALQPCSEGWFEWVEERVGTGDGAGHGPDVGSTEWRYTVVFRMGIEGQSDVPDVDDESWCGFVNERLLNDLSSE